MELRTSVCLSLLPDCSCRDDGLCPPTIATINPSFLKLTLLGILLSNRKAIIIPRLSFLM